MHTLHQLRSGKLNGSNHLRLSEGLTSFPEEIFELCDTLEILDLSGNKLSALPADMHRLHRLKIAFFSDNEFTVFPSSLAACPLLTMIGFKANRIEEIPEHAFPEHLRWLILTNNTIRKLPASIGHCHRLQKVMLAGNRLTTLPPEMAACRNIQLLRISANAFTQLPAWLFTLPRLAWLAFSGNPCSVKETQAVTSSTISWNDLESEEILGEGASGVITKVRLRNKGEYAAVKVFKGDVTSDGLPADEMNACMRAGTHPNLITVLDRIYDHPEGKQVLLLSLVPPSYRNLGGPPSFDTCTRDTFPENKTFSASSILSIARGIASVCEHLHKHGILHGDLYAHNILVEDGNPLLSDFGAATLYDLSAEYSAALERLDVLAFACLLEDLLVRVEERDLDHPWIKVASELLESCRQEESLKRPCFSEICRILA